MARGIARYLKDLGEESFVEAKPSLAKAKAELALEVVKHIISVKQAEKAAAEAKLETEARRKKIQEALASKQDAALANMSEEDLKAELASLNAQ